MGKKLLLFIFFVLSCITIGGYGLVFATNFSFQTQARFIGTVGEALYLHVPHLAQDILVYESSSDLSKAQLSSSCEIRSRFVSSHKTLYFFQVDYSQDQDCENKNIILELSGQKIVSSLASIELKNPYSEIAAYLDYGTATLENLLTNTKAQEKRYAIYKNYKGQDIAKYYKYLQGQRKYLEALQKINTLEHIIAARSLKYSSPVPGRNIAEKFTKIPNSGRPYREGYTDGIHHGWDIDAPIGADLAALDEGLIVRVVKDFSGDDFNRIVYGTGLSDIEKLKNLDILRGNQVWLKTMKGEVVFYSHLDTVDPSIKEGMRVQRGDTLGTVGISGVPEEGYSDSHLHFEIAQNPYKFDLAGSYDFGDYMSWPWLTKGLNETQTIAAQKNIFED